MMRKRLLVTVGLVTLAVMAASAEEGRPKLRAVLDDFSRTIEFYDTGGDVPNPAEELGHGGPSAALMLRVGAMSCTFRLTSNEGFYYNMAYIARIYTPNRGQQISWRSYSYNTPSLSGGVDADPVSGVYGDYICEVEWNVNGMYLGTDTATVRVSAPPPPHATIASDTGDVARDGVTRRDIWYQLFRADNSIWPYGGTVNEAMTPRSNPCGLPIVTGLSGAVNPNGQYLDTYTTSTRSGPPENCRVEADQSYTLNTANNGVVRKNRIVWEYKKTTIWEI